MGTGCASAQPGSQRCGAGVYGSAAAALQAPGDNGVHAAVNGGESGAPPGLLALARVSGGNREGRGTPERRAARHSLAHIPFRTAKLSGMASNCMRVEMVEK